MKILVLPFALFLVVGCKDDEEKPLPKSTCMAYDTGSQDTGNQDTGVNEEQEQDTGAEAESNDTGANDPSDDESGDTGSADDAATDTGEPTGVRKASQLTTLQVLARHPIVLRLTSTH